MEATRIRLAEGVHLTYLPARNSNQSAFRTVRHAPAAGDGGSQRTAGGGAAAGYGKLSRYGSALRKDGQPLRCLHRLHSAEKGENQCVGFVASFIDDRYAPGGERLLEPAAALLGELVCDPVTYHGRFVPEYFESEKTNLLEAIRSLINDKRDWADSRLLRALCDGEAYAVPRLGDEETVDKLQALKVYTQYRDLISTAPLEIIYSGSADLERVKQALAAAFATLPREEVRVISTAAPHVCRESVQHVEDVLDVTQGKLGMGFPAAVTMCPLC